VHDRAIFSGVAFRNRTVIVIVRFLLLMAVDQSTSLAGLG
jgi:hypothetical protein